MLRFLPLALAGLVTLSACDTVTGNDDITGTWSTTVNFQVDTLLSDQNYRVVADYDATYTFELLNEDGLIYGRITSALDGVMSGQEAGREPTVYTLNPEDAVSDYVFGTYDDPALEVDVPWGRYEDNLWTFTKVGGRAELDGRVVHEWSFETVHAAQPGQFSITLDGNNKATTTIRRSSTEAPALQDPATIVPQARTAVHVYSDAALNGARVRK